MEHLVEFLLMSYYGQLGSPTIPCVDCKCSVELSKTQTLSDFFSRRTAEGDMFVVKDPDLFASQVIPQYFDHNKFSSFARQLNFYGFRKMQSKPIRNSDYDAGTAKHVTFYNENFKRGRCDLLKKIQRSTRGGNATPGQDHSKEIQNLKEQVSTLEQQITDMNTQFEERLRRVELDMLGRMEQMMLTVQQQQQTQLQLQKVASVGSAAPSQVATQNWEPNALPYPRGDSVNSNANSIGMNSVTNSHGGGGIRPSPSPHFSGSSIGVRASPGPPLMNGNIMNFQQQQQQQQHAQQQQAQQQQSQPNKMAAPPTLPPHPKQKQLPLPSIPGVVGAPPDRLNSLRGISQLTRGLSRGASGLSRGASIESSASAMLMRNSWEDKFFSMLMLDANDQSGGQAQNAHAIMNPTPIGNNANNNGAPPVLSNRSVDFNGTGNSAAATGEGDLSSVSSSDIP